TSRPGSGKTLAARLFKIEKRRCHHDTDCVAAEILSSSVAATVSIKPCHGFDRAHFEGFAEHVIGRRPTINSFIPVVTQHYRPPAQQINGKRARSRLSHQSIWL